MNAKARVDVMRADLAAAKSKVTGAQADLDLAWTELHAPLRCAVVGLTIGEAPLRRRARG